MANEDLKKELAELKQKEKEEEEKYNLRQEINKRKFKKSFFGKVMEFGKRLDKKFSK